MGGGGGMMPRPRFNRSIFGGGRLHMGGPPSPAHNPKIPQQQPATVAGIGGMAQEAQAMNQAAKVASREDEFDMSSRASGKALAKGEQLQQATHSEAAVASYSAYLAGLTSPDVATAVTNPGNGALDKAAAADTTAGTPQQQSRCNNDGAIHTFLSTHATGSVAGTTKIAAMPVPSQPMPADPSMGPMSTIISVPPAPLIDRTIQPNLPMPGAEDMKVPGIVPASDGAWDVREQLTRSRRRSSPSSPGKRRGDQ
jgi:hypothetical protein